MISWSEFLKLLNQGGIDAQRVFWTSWKFWIESLASTDKRVSGTYIAVSALIALGIFFIRRHRAGKGGFVQLLREVAPPEIYLHRSSLQDYLWYIISPVMYLPLVAAFGFVSPVFSYLSYGGLISAIGKPTPVAPDITVSLVYSLLLLIMLDLGNYVAHWLMHRVPSLWEFHKTHHSAEVLNPLTAARLHPLERLMLGIFTGIFSGLLIGVFAYWYQPFATPTRFLGANIFGVLTNVISGNLRHSHVWLSYGTFFEHIFSSPAQHQIHHSRQPEHFNKNLAVHFAFWDWIFGTLHIASREPQKLDLGLEDHSEKQWQSPWALLLLPFVMNWKRWRSKPVTVL